MIILARLKKDVQNRKNTYDALLFALAKNGDDKEYYKNQIDQYMLFYDELLTLNNRIADVKKRINDKEYIELVKEKRQVNKEMRSILTFLNLSPISVGGDPENDPDEDL